jgi:hypothetical protein
MKGVNKILEFLGGGFVGDLMGGLDNLFTSKEDKIKAKAIIQDIIAKKELALQKMQADIITTEAKGNWLQRSWRPILMLAFGFVVIYCKFIGPLFGLTVPPLESEFWNLLQLGIGGYVIGRTGEKMIKSYVDGKK